MFKKELKISSNGNTVAVEIDKSHSIYIECEDKNYIEGIIEDFFVYLTKDRLTKRVSKKTLIRELENYINSILSSNPYDDMKIASIVQEEDLYKEYITDAREILGIDDELLLFPLYLIVRYDYQTEKKHLRDSKPEEGRLIHIRKLKTIITFDNFINESILSRLLEFSYNIEQRAYLEIYKEIKNMSEGKEDFTISAFKILNQMIEVL